MRPDSTACLQQLTTTTDFEFMKMALRGITIIIADGDTGAGDLVSHRTAAGEYVTSTGRSPYELPDLQDPAP